MMIVENVEPTWLPVFKKEEANNLFPHYMGTGVTE